MVTPASQSPEGERLSVALASTVVDIFRSSGRFTGYDCLRATCARLAEVLGIKAVYVAESLPSRQRARVVATSEPNAGGEGAEFRLRNPEEPGPNEAGSAGPGLRPVGSSSEEPFEEPGMNSLTASLRSHSGELIGVLTMVHSQTYGGADFASALLSEMAPHVAAELEALQQDREIVRNEARLRLQFQYSRDVLFYYLARERRFDFISAAVEGITGYPPEAFLANAHLGEEIVQASDRKRLADWILAGAEGPITVKITAAGGETRWLEVACQVFRDSEGEVIACCGAGHDFTATAEALNALTLSEQYKSALLQSCPDTLFKVDSMGMVLDYVPGDEIATLDWNSTVVGRHLRQMMPANMAVPLTQLINIVLETGELHQTQLEVFSRGKTSIYETRCIRLTSNEVILRIRDITGIRTHDGEEGRRRFREEHEARIDRARANPYQLTYREMAILHLVAEGQADKQIADSLKISTYTVNKHVGNILGK
ncbi:MAG TPA: PAS domain-containing protein, partial [Dehalococcoidia bacterium]